MWQFPMWYFIDNSTKLQNQEEDLWQQFTRAEEDTQKTKLSLNFPKPEEQGRQHHFTKQSVTTHVSGNFGMNTLNISKTDHYCLPKSYAKVLIIFWAAV